MIERILTATWLQRGWLAWLLWPFSVLYGTVLGIRRLAYRLGWLHSERFKVPVLVVGNVAVGGAGKTPVVMALTQHLQAKGIQVGVVSRGYGRTDKACRVVTPTSPVTHVGDEPLLIARRTAAAVVVARDRAQAAQTLLTQFPNTQVIICDDGLQHWALQRDLEIGVFDDRGIGNGFLLPAGLLREPWPRPLDLLLHTGQTPAFSGFTAQRSLAEHAVRADGSLVTLTDIIQNAATQPLLALAAIAQPEQFFAMLRAQGVPLEMTLSLPDHYDFRSFSRNEYKRYSILCTEKDAVKLWAIDPTALAVPLQFTPESGFWNAFDQRLQPLLLR